MIEIALTVNGRRHERRVEPRLLLSDFLRHELSLYGTHVGCEHGVCGACTVLLDGRPARSCLTLAVQADGRDITTAEAAGRRRELAGAAGLRDCHGLSSLCTLGFPTTITPACAPLTDGRRPRDDGGTGGAARAGARQRQRPAPWSCRDDGALAAATTRLGQFRLRFWSHWPGSGSAHDQLPPDPPPPSLRSSLGARGGTRTMLVEDLGS
jgi:aerobic-type carbon monoxide dehydrogenase small subunit (CoxS/CutS family)